MVISRRALMVPVAAAVVAAVAVVAVLVIRHRDPAAPTAAGSSASSAADVPDPSVRPDGDPVKVEVSPAAAFSVAVAGVGRLTAPAGAFASAGTVTVRKLAATAPAGSLVVVGGTGVDVSFAGTRLRSPITVSFDDPATRGRMPAGAIPVVLHRPAGGAWEVRPAAGLRLATTDFSPNLFGWIPIPGWVTSIGDSIADYATQRTDPRPCPGGAPNWSSTSLKTTLVHLCSITNTDKAAKAVRAELQVQSNRRFFQWVSVAPGADYVYAEDEPDWFRTALAKLTRTSAVLLAGNGLVTAGYRQPKQTKTKAFNGSLDYYSAFFSVADVIMGLDVKDTVQGSIVTLVHCARDEEIKAFPNAESVKDLVQCFVEDSLKSLDNPDRAFAQALDLYGEAGYAKEAEASLRKSITRLRFLGKLIKIIGIAGVITSAFSQLPDVFSEWGNDHPGAFTMKLTGSAAAATTFRTVDPWHDGSAAKATAQAAPAGSDCVPSELAPRRDGYRCFVGSEIHDPCFADPADGGAYACAPPAIGGPWTKFTGLARDSGDATGAPGKSGIFLVKLADGAECSRHSGSGPAGVPGYPFWVGFCTGGPLGSDGKVWRIGDGMSAAATYPLYPTSDPNAWTAAVETSPGHVERLPVMLAWR